jgi:hypothetical protein
MSHSFDDVLHDSIEVDFFQSLDPMSLKVRIEVRLPNQDLATNLRGRERINRRVNPGAKCPLRNVSILGELSEPQPFTTSLAGGAFSPGRTSIIRTLFFVFACMTC